MYFTFDNEAFPDPKAMLETLLASNRKLVTQIDPHFKDNK
jgi:alpha-glucosidase (family GH31 glycosyl hydrolase)